VKVLRSDILRWRREITNLVDANAVDDGERVGLELALGESFGDLMSGFHGIALGLSEEDSLTICDLLPRLLFDDIDSMLASTQAPTDEMLTFAGSERKDDLLAFIIGDKASGVRVAVTVNALRHNEGKNKA
jgi:hypothetical protein